LLHRVIQYIRLLTKNILAFLYLEPGYHDSPAQEAQSISTFGNVASWVISIYL